MPAQVLPWALRPGRKQSSVQFALDWSRVGVLAHRRPTQTVRHCAAHLFCGAADLLQLDHKALLARKRLAPQLIQTWRTFWRNTRCHTTLKPLCWNRSGGNRRLHGMQGVSGSSPLGSISSDSLCRKGSFCRPGNR
jgi:hypothetical protein